MKHIQREDIHILARHSDVGEEGIDRALTAFVYPKAPAWHRFLRILFLVLGLGFSVLGIIFFFAYNWADLHKFAKLGIVETLLLLTTALSLHPKFNKDARNIILTGSAVLVGVLFAVFGQIYQTGANAYDFFLAWTLFIALWTLIANFAPLWLLFLVLANTTFILYGEQVAADWDATLLFTFLFLGNALCLLLITVIPKYRSNQPIPIYFSNIVALATATFATIGIVLGIIDNEHAQLPVLSASVGILYAIGIWYALKNNNSFYLALIPFSIIVIITAILFDIFDEEYMYLFVSFFIIVSVTLVVRNLIHLQKRNNHEKQG